MSWRDEYPFKSNFLPVNGQQMHYVDVCENLSTAAPMLFLHGNPTWSFLWRRLIRHFAARHRCIAPDHIGCGLSDKPQQYPYTLATHIDNTCALVEQLDLQQITLVVHDWGGAIGMGMAGRMPDRIARLVVCNTAAFPSDAMPSSIALARVPGVGALAIRGLNAFVRGALATCAMKPLTRSVRAGFLAPYKSWRTRVANLRFVQDIPMNPRHPSWATLQSVEAGLTTLRGKPMLLCWGGRDYVFTRAFLEQWVRRFPHAWEKFFPDAGHFVTEDAHEEIVAAIEAFVGAYELKSPVPVAGQRPQIPVGVAGN